MGEMRVMNHTGDLKVVWNRNSPDEVAAAERQFNELRGKGYAAFSVQGKSGEKGEQIRQFDPNAERIILAPQMQGG